MAQKLKKITATLCLIAIISLFVSVPVFAAGSNNQDSCKDTTSNGKVDSRSSKRRHRKSGKDGGDRINPSRGNIQIAIGK